MSDRRDEPMVRLGRMTRRDGMQLRRRHNLVAILVFGVVLSQCRTGPDGGSSAFRIVAESEVRALHAAGILDAFTKETGIQLSIDYAGPVDIQAALSIPGLQSSKSVDAYWPGSSLWLPGSTPVEPHSIMKTYVVLAVDPGVAGELGWDPHRGITASQLVDGVRSGRINLAMPSASQSNAGAIFYLAMYTALAGQRVLTADDLANPEAVEGIRALLGGIDRSAESLEHLKQVVVDDRLSGTRRFNAIVLYETLAIAMNQELVSRGQSPFTVFYVDGATAIADVPIRYVDNGDAAKAEQYGQLVAYLSRPDVQSQIQALGWRTNPVGMALKDADPAIFNPAWGIDTTTEFREMVLPKAPVVAAALRQYQRAFRKPSFTAYCLDYSGSMRSNHGREQMIDAMDLLLDQERAATVLLEATEDDVTVVFGFSWEPTQIGGEVRGSDPGRLKDLAQQIASANMDGSTALFGCIERALAYLGGQYEPERYQYSVIAMTDGASNTGLTAQQFLAAYSSQQIDIPVYGIAFGAADFSQLNALVETGGQVYDGRVDIATAFRRAKGNN